MTLITDARSKSYIVARGFMLNAEFNSLVFNQCVEI